ncbi:MAG: hypothetical protein PHH68_08540 [Candidatus Omnitrophica bacterium]|nr:hypothetical protein [Candidatus Omnitrophota bacterium]
MIKIFREGNYGSNLKSQSLSEMAVFGTILLLVLGFLLRYGLQYNYQQQVKMEAFRRSMKMAEESNAPQSQQITVVKDVQIPNPQDIFGQGERTTIRGSSDIFWSNNTTGLDYSSDEGLPSVTYVFNPDKAFSGRGVYSEIEGSSSVEKGVTKEYTLATTMPIPSLPIGWGNVKLKGVTDIFNMQTADQAKVYQQEEGYGSKEILVLLNSGKDCNEEYCETAILEEAEVPETGTGKPRYYSFISTGGDVGSPPENINLLDSEGGQLNSTLMAQQTEDKVIDRHDNLTITTDSGVLTSTDTLYEAEAITHKLGADDPTFVFYNTTTQTWTTSD